MEAVHKTLIYRGDGGPYRKLMPEKKLFCSGKVQDESKYVELDNLLDLKPECSKTVKVTFTGEGNHLAIFNCKNGVGATEEKAADEKKLVAGDLSDSLEFTSSSESSRESDLSTECPTGAQDYEELQYTDIFLNRRAESPGSLTSDELAAPPAATTTAASGTAGVSAGEEHEDEAHYITTHEIQLCELDHDVDCDFGQGSCWDFEEDNLACPFVDYASFDSDQAAALEGTAGVAEPHAAPGPTATGRVAVSTTRESDPLCHTDARGSSLGAPSQHQNGGSGTSAGQIHLSIKATSRAINEPSNARKPLENSGCHAERLGGGGGDMSQGYAFTSAGAKVGRGDEGGKCFIAAPRRLHITGRKDLGEFHSSGASSAVSELDDADKEVRSLTARAFRSLACPYLDALQFSTSSDSSASFTEGVNRWSAFVDLKYGSLASAAGRKRSTFEFNQSGSSPPSCAVLLNGGAAPDPPKSKPKPKPDQVNGVPPDAEQLLTLTETFNFRCNVTDERRAKLVQNVSGSRSTDEVTDALPRELGTGASQPACKAGEAMEGTQQKAKFASSLLKNVISKKMQFEQERKMERGEISETTSSSSSGLSPTLDRLISGEPRLLRRQGSRFSEASSDHTVVSTDEPGEGEPPGPDAAKGLLLRSHNSAFRSWRDGESEQMGDKGEQRDEEPSDGKATKMSHLFVPSIQSAGKEAEAAKPTGHLQYSSRAVSYLEGGGGGGGAEEPSPAPGVPKCEGASKSPEIKISLRSVKESRANPFNIAKLLTPNIGSQTKVAEDCKSQGLPPNTFKGQPLERVPQFTVRDIRDNKCKLQTPIHQVRDVRKLVKSSYNFGAVDGSDASAEQKSTSQGGLGKTGSVSPIVIKCQSVNTKNNLQQDPELPKAQPGEEVALSAHLLEGATIMFHRTTGRMPPPAAVKPPQKTEPFEPAGVHIEAKAFKRKPENPTDASEKKPETTLVNQAALEKLKAAVKTMEQLYVFDRNEWKRKTEPHPITDSHVLSLIASEEGGHGEGKLSTSKEESLPPQQRLVRRNSYPNAERSTPKPTLACDISIKKGNKENLKTPNKEDRERPGMATQPGSAIVTKNALHTSHNPKSASTANGPFSASKGQQPVFNTKGLVPKFPHIPMSLKIGPSKATPEGLGKAEGTGQEPKSTAACDSENYLTIPVKPHPSDAKAAPGSQEQSSGYLFTTPGVRTHDASPSHSDFKRLEDTRQSPKRSSVVMETRSPETPTATIYHHSLPIAMSGVQPQVICFSPSVPPAPAIEPFQPTQRKMLLDPTTGHYYLVDTPVQPATKRLFDPETGQYVDIPMPQQPVTPVPVPVSPIALSPGAYGTTYMIYPSFLPTTTVLPARTLHTQLSSHSEGDDVDKTNSKEGAQSGTTGDVAYMESPYYFATGKSVPVQTTMQHVTARAPKGLSEGKPVISITSQQGPRIIAPPSFDGTTMSFVVEHR